MSYEVDVKSAFKVYFEVLAARFYFPRFTIFAFYSFFRRSKFKIELIIYAEFRCQILGHVCFSLIRAEYRWY